MENLSINDLILINQYSQGLIPKKKVDEWFYKFNDNDKRIILKTIWQFALQANIIESDVINVYNKLKIKKTSTPMEIMLSTKYPFVQRGYNLLKLDGIVLYQAFWLILECFIYVDGKRKKNEDINKCNHWWHKDLSDPDIINEIVLKYKDFG